MIKETKSAILIVRARTIFYESLNDLFNARVSILVINITKLCHNGEFRHDFKNELHYRTKPLYTLL
jgi:hypothetical protein